MKDQKIAALGAAALVVALSAAPALADVSEQATQTANTVNVTTTGTNASSVTNAATSTNGAVTLNNTAGNANEQANLLALDPTTVHANDATTLRQTGASATITSTSQDTSQISGSTLAGSSTGSAAVNDAAGDANQQANALIVTRGGGSTSFFGVPTQIREVQNGATGNVVESAPGDNPLSVTSTVNGDAARNYSGNAALNSAAGDVNQQQNALTISSPATSGPFLSINVGQTTQSFAAEDASKGKAQGAIDGSALIGGYAVSGVNGAAAVNSASGIGNAQANATSIVHVPASSFEGTLHGADQRFAGSLASMTVGSQTTRIDGNAGAGISGVGALNAASGIQNAQANTTALLTATSQQSSANALETITQTSGGGETDALFLPLESSVEGKAASGGTGIVGVNAAAGLQNAQANAAFLSQTGTAVGSYQSANQSTTGTTATLVVSSLSSGVGGAAVSNVTGVAALNDAAGSNNMQINQTAVNRGSTLSGSSPFNTPYVQSSGSSQSIGGASQASLDFGFASSTIVGTAGSAGTGIVGINSASGALNQQSNAALLVDNALGRTAGQGISQTNTASGTSDASLTLSLAHIGDSAGSGASGDVALNSASGLMNQQANQLMILHSGTPGSAIKSTASSSQTITSNDTIDDTANTATIDGNALTSTHGVGTANSAAGIANEQGNVVIVSDGGLTGAAPSTTQKVTLTVTSSSPVTNTASTGGAAFSSSSGAVSGNVSAGVGTQQLNTIQLGSH